MTAAGQIALFNAGGLKKSTNANTSYCSHMPDMYAGCIRGVCRALLPLSAVFLWTIHCAFWPFRNEEEMYKVLLSDYEQRQKQLMLENAELKKVLQQMKKEMISILSPQKPKTKEKLEDSLGPVSKLVSFLYLPIISGCGVGW